MRRLLTGFVVGAMATIIPSLALAGNQEIAEQIAHRLRNSGQMSDYSVAVKYQDGTAWLRGHVSCEEQMKTALRLTFQTKSVNRIVNNLTVASGAPQTAVRSEQNPLRGAVRQTAWTLRDNTQDQRPQPQTVRGDASSYADRVPSSYSPAMARRVANEEPEEIVEPVQRGQVMTRGASNVAMMQPGMGGAMQQSGSPMPMYRAASSPASVAPARYDQPCLPNYAWPSYASYPNYAAVTYPKQYSPTAWPYIGPFYPYPQVPLGWRKVTLEWDSGWWFLDFKDQPASCWHR